MLVYRICSRREADWILSNGNFDNVGFFSFIYKGNNHKYEDGYRYMHFFLDKSSVIYHSLYQKRCVCTYDIPDDLLNQNCSVGEYSSEDNYKEKIYLTEFAIKTEDMRIEFLKKVEEFFPKDSSNSLCDLANSLDVIYEAPRFVIRERVQKFFSRIFK